MIDQTDAANATRTARGSLPESALPFAEVPGMNLASEKFDQARRGRSQKRGSCFAFE
jgi:hypothetical protein